MIVLNIFNFCCSLNGQQFSTMCELDNQSCEGIKICCGSYVCHPWTKICTEAANIPPTDRRDKIYEHFDKIAHSFAYPFVGYSTLCELSDKSCEGIKICCGDYVCHPCTKICTKASNIPTACKGDKLFKHFDKIAHS
ncbi:hypothetical protein HCN44_010758 [Aphidius gifuensis]|uniref:Uncharacterized protein n=1 Tax=Aphidius gifuensis TaxID=684658 RepID=A0A834XUP0_APHGI|nr:hypothetical protein HCN44_010758 [Aphidius gifuensis]